MPVPVLTEAQWARRVANLFRRAILEVGSGQFRFTIRYEDPELTDKFIKIMEEAGYDTATVVK